MTPQQVQNKASELHTTVNAEIIRRWPSHNRFTFDRMIQDVCSRHMGDNWDYNVLWTTDGQPPRVSINAYRGPLDYSKQEQK